MEKGSLNPSAGFAVLASGRFIVHGFIAPFWFPPLSLYICVCGEGVVRGEGSNGCEDMMVGKPLEK